MPIDFTEGEDAGGEGGGGSGASGTPARKTQLPPKRRSQRQMDKAEREEVGQVY